MSFCYGILQYLNTLSIRQTYEIFFQYALQTFYQPLIEHVIQELHIIGTVIQSPFHTVFDKLFRQIHVIRNIIECHFRLNHPELGKMTGGI